MTGVGVGVIVGVSVDSGVNVGKGEGVGVGNGVDDGGGGSVGSPPQAVMISPSRNKHRVVLRIWLFPRSTSVMDECDDERLPSSANCTSSEHLGQN